MGLIYLDSCLLIYAIENDPLWSSQVVNAMAAELPGSFAISPLVKLECMVKPLKTGDLALQSRYAAGLGELVVLAVSEPVFLQAAELRARFGLRTPDALHLACAQYHGCSSIWTNDDRLGRAAHGLARNVLKKTRRVGGAAPRA